MVLSIWTLQMGALVYFALRDADFAAFLARLKGIFLNPLVWALVAGCIGFLFAGGSAARNYDIAGVTFAGISFWIELALLAGLVLRLLFQRYRRGSRSLVFGSAEFATPLHAQAMGLIGETGIRLGYLRGALSIEGRGLPLHYTGERHLLTIAPTRAGKGVSTIIPNLLTYHGSLIVVNPKGENTLATHKRRSGMSQMEVLDPWDITGKAASRFNPLDALTPDSPTLVEDATLIAEALIVPETGGHATHFSEQAADLIKGFLLYLVTTPGEVKTLGRLRDILTSAPAEITKIAITMATSTHPVIKAAAAQIASKNDKEWLSILSTAQRNTHFLDSTALRESLATSHFQFEEMKGDIPISLYLVLPVDRLSSHARWLRMILAVGIARMARDTQKPVRPVYFMLDEFAALGRMQIVEDAYGLMAGMGIQMHAIVQDLNQLQRIYGDGWQTFVAGAGAIQLFGTRDLMTAEYFSKLIGVATETTSSTSFTSGSSSGQGGGSSSSSHTVSSAATGRPLLFPDELMRMDSRAQIVLVENANPCVSDKIVWHEDAKYRALAGV